MEQYLPTFKFHENIDDVCHDTNDDQLDHDNDEKGEVLDETKIISHQLAIGFVTKPHLSSLEGLSVSVRLFVCLCLSMCVGVCVFEGEKITKR